MGTTKLGLKIAKSYTGYTDGFGVNENTAWIKSVRDTRDDCKHVLGLKEDCDTSVIMYSATQVGEFYTIVSKIAGRQTDFISAWIYCPLDIEIPGPELSKIIEATRQEILANEVNEDRLLKLFSNEYNQVRIPKTCTPTEGNLYAVRYYGSETMYGSLSELLGSNMAQPENKEYKGIFLIDSKSTIKGSPDCVNITKVPLKESFILNPPKEALGYTPFYNGSPFTSPVRLIKGDKLTITWRKEEFKDVTTETIIDGPETKINAVTEVDERVVIRLGDFDIHDEEGRVDKENLTIRVGNVEINNNQNAAIHVSNLENCELSILGEGYKQFRKHVDLRNKPVSIRLETNSYVYECRIPLELEEGVKAECKATIKSNRRFEHTPIKGYHSRQGFYYNADTIDLYYEEPRNNKRTLIIALIGLLAGLIIGATSIGFLANNKIKKLEKVNQKAQTEQTEKIEKERQEQQAKKSIKAAINYLNEHTDWVKTEMEQYEKLKGVWNELNTYQYESLKRHTDLTKSKRYDEIINLFDALNNANGLQKLGNPYSNDESINLTRYTSKLRNTKNDAENQSAKRNSAPEASKAKNNQSEKSKEEKDKNKAKNMA